MIPPEPSLIRPCRICDRPISPFMSFGRMPLANGFLSPSEFEKEFFYELQAAFCSDCGMIQLIDPPDPNQLFHERYPFFSGTSSVMSAHFERLALAVMRRLPKDRSFVVEIGSNDGTLLRQFAEKGFRHLGVEPSGNVARAAAECGVNTLQEFFDESVASEITRTSGTADAILAANVLCHIPDLHAALRGIRRLLNPDGIFVFEDPYVCDVLSKTAYDQIYDEHVFLFSVTAIQYLMSRHSLEVIDLEPQPTHGGSMRYTVAHAGRYPVCSSVGRALDEERAHGLLSEEICHKFRRSCKRSRDALRSLVTDLRRSGRRVVGYAATSKSTTVTNYCGLTPDLIEFISDTTPVKQGTFSPGVHIPVRPPEAFSRHYPDYALLFGWNHKTEILSKERAFGAAGGKWIVYVPEVTVLS